MRQALLTIFTALTFFLSVNYAQDTVPGTALHFDGIDGYVQIADHASLDITGSITIEAWIFPRSAPSIGMRIVDKSYVGTSQAYLLDTYPSNQIRMIIAPNTLTTSEAIPVDQWSHVAAVYDSAAGWQGIFINGKLKASASGISGNLSTNNNSVRLGANSDLADNFFDGRMDEVRIWNTARSVYEIREYMHLTLNGSETGLVSYWQFNDSTGTTAIDPISGNDGTLHNMNNSDWVTSGTPIGGGTSYTNIVNTTGTFNFSGTNLSMDFNEKTGTDTIVVSKLDLAPNTALSGYFTLNSQYWIVNKFGGGTFNSNLVFTPNEIISSGDEMSPDILHLFSRSSNSLESWSNLKGALTASASGNSVTFDSLNSFGQFLIGRQWFTGSNTGLTEVSNSSVAWGDYDSDGDLDILLSGATEDYPNYNPVSKIYRNDSGTFTDINAGLTGVYDGSVTWGDYDNDGDLDILLSGKTSSSGISRIYRNDSDGFSQINVRMPCVQNSSVAWGDYDNDGDLDILITGDNIARIYRNDSGIFTDINAGLIGVEKGSVAWGDYDNDGDLDILLTGSASYTPTSRIYRNDSGIFTDINAGLTDVMNGSVAWGDYDNDGDFDILLTGIDSFSNFRAGIYQNNNGVFTYINIGLPKLWLSSVAWGDYDNDGDLDIMLTGYASGAISRIYRNDPSTGSGRVFTDINAGLTGVYSGSAAWGDYDNDGDLDILLTGSGISRIYRNNNVVPNSNPLAPSGLNAVLSAGSLTFSWNKALDNETPQDGLSYNLVLGNSEHDLFIKPPMANVINGYRKIPDIGNVCQINSWSYNNGAQVFSFPQVELPDYWGVQTIDHSFDGSPFAIDSINIPISYLQTINNNIMQSTDLLSWEIQIGDSIVSYQLQIDDDSTFSSCEVNDTLFVSLGGSEFYYSTQLQSFTGSDSLVAGTKYYWRIKPNYTFGLQTVYTDSIPSFWFEYEPTAIEDGQEICLPKEFTLHQNYPNPFNPLTTIKYDLPKASNIKIELFDLLGRKVQTLLDSEKEAGYHSYIFNAGNLASGVYIYKIQAGEFTDIKKLLLMK